MSFVRNVVATGIKDRLDELESVRCADWRSE